MVPERAIRAVYRYLVIEHRRDNVLADGSHVLRINLDRHHLAMALGRPAETACGAAATVQRGLAGLADGDGVDRGA